MEVGEQSVLCFRLHLFISFRLLFTKREPKQISEFQKGLTCRIVKTESDHFQLLDLHPSR